MALTDISTVTPLGNLNPPGHVHPTDHMYFYAPPLVGGTLAVPLVSPGSVVVSEITLNRRSVGGVPTNEDYGLTFAACADVRMAFAHVTELAPSFAANVGAVDGSCDAPYVTGGVTSQQCRKRLRVQLEAGEPIGKTGGPMQGGLDFTALDRRVSLPFVNPERSWGASSPFGQNQAACPLDYFVPSVAASLRARLGRPGFPRTVEPICGEVMQDVAGTAAGRWFRVGVTSAQDDSHLALVHDNVDPTRGVFSVGTSVPSMPSGTYSFTPTVEGRVNLDFQRVTTVGTTYCYQISLPPTQLRVLLTLVSPTRVRVQGYGNGPCGDPSAWAFGAGWAEFER
jgi:hypothetical protein